MFPEIRFSDDIVIPTYLPYLSLLYCFLVFYVFHRAQKLKMNTRVALDLALILMVGGFVGGRLVHAFYEMPLYYLEDLTRLLKFWEGGFVFYGGFAVAFVGCWIYVKRTKISFFDWADFYAPVIALGYGLGRIACFLSGCCYGAACDLPWGIKRHPTQLYAVIWELCVFALLLNLPSRMSRRPGMIFSIWLFMHAWGRLMMEQYRDDFRGDLILGLTISTWFSFFLMLSALAIFPRKRQG